MEAAQKQVKTSPPAQRHEKPSTPIKIRPSTPVKAPQAAAAKSQRRKRPTVTALEKKVLNLERKMKEAHDHINDLKLAVSDLLANKLP